MQLLNLTKNNTMAFFEPDFLQFFIELAPNNHKDWFDSNRKRYEQVVKKPFANFIQHMIGRMAELDPSFKDLEPKDCIFRINRDIRFSKDKSPYKLMYSAVIAPGGKKSRAINGVYLEFGPEHVRVYGGVYEVNKEEIHQIRQGILENRAKFKSIYSADPFKSVYGSILGEKNKMLPKEFKPFAAEEPLLYNKQWYFYTQFDPITVLDEKLDDIILDSFLAGREVEEFLFNCIKSTN